jgi:hypothetical protein
MRGMNSQIPSLDWFSPAMQRVQNQHRAHLDALFRGDDVEPFYIWGVTGGASHGLWGTNTIDMLREPRAWLEDVLRDLEEWKNAALDEHTFRPLVIELDALGTHFIDAIFGAPTGFESGQVWSQILPYDLAELEMPNLENCETFQQSLELARLAVEYSQGKLFISNPVLSCSVNIALNLFSDEIYLALEERPDDARRALRIINDVIIECMRAFNGILPQQQHLVSVGAHRAMPPGFGSIDGCATQMISRLHYEEFFAPLDDELLQQHANGGMIHLCGAHAQHIPVWRNMKSLRAIQLNDRAADDLERYFAGTRDDQILYVMPTAQTPAKRVLEITGGRRVVLQMLREE